MENRISFFFFFFNKQKERKLNIRDDFITSTYGSISLASMKKEMKKHEESRKRKSMREGKCLLIL